MKYDEELAQKVFENLYIAHLYSVWALVENETLPKDEAFEWLRIAVDEKTDATALKEKLPTKGGFDKGGWNGVYAVYVYGVLVDNGGDCCHGVTAASGYGLYIGLDSGSSAGVAAGYT